METPALFSLPCLAVGVSPEYVARLKEAYPDLRLTEMPCELDRLMDAEGEPPAAVVCGEPPENTSITEVAQLLRMKYQDAPIYLLVGANSRHDRKKLLKNGLTDVFFLPLDQELLAQALRDLAARRGGPGKTFRAVKLMDLQADTVLGFDTHLYLPANNKHIKFTSAGSEIEKERLARLRQGNLTSLFVSTTDMPKVHQYTAEVLRKMGSNETMSETEKSERLQSAVRELVSGLFSDRATGTESGKSVLQDCQEVVRNYVSKGKSGQWYERILAITGGSSGTYSRAANVSALASLFALGIGNKNVDDIAIAGLLHDVGLAMLPPELLKKDYSEMTALERIAYQKHPDHSIEMIRSRKIVVSELVHRIILQHHECFNGSGYPNGTRGARLSVEAQILFFADRFDELTAVVPGRISKSPVEAARELAAQVANDPSKAFIEPTLMKRLVALFPEEATQDPPQAA